MSKSASISESCGIVCTEVFEEGYIPSADEIKRYAEDIGIDLDKEKHLMHLARAGLMEPLPRCWKPIRDETTGAYYYYNKNTKQTQWGHPVDEKYKQRVNTERTKMKLSANITPLTISSRKPEENTTHAKQVMNTLFKTNSVDSDTNKMEETENKQTSRRLGRFSERHISQKNIDNDTKTPRIVIPLDNKPMDIDRNVNKNHGFSLSDDSKIDTDLSLSDDMNFVKNIHIEMKDKQKVTDKINRNIFHEENNRNAVLKPLIARVNEFNKDINIEDTEFRQTNSNRVQGGKVKSLQSHFTALTNPFKKLPPLSSKSANNDVESKVEEKSNSKSFEEKLKSLSEKLNSSIVESCNKKSDDLIKKSMFQDHDSDDVISKDENLHSLLKKYEIGDGKHVKSFKKVEKKSVVDLLDNNAIDDEQVSGISLSYRCPDKPDEKTNTKDKNNLVAKARRSLFFTKMTDAMKAKPLSIDTDSETDSAMNNKHRKINHKIIIANEIPKPKAHDISDRSSHHTKEPIKAFPRNFESDDSTAFDISVNLSQSEMNKSEVASKNPELLNSEMNKSEVISKNPELSETNKSFKSEIPSKNSDEVLVMESLVDKSFMKKILPDIEKDVTETKLKQNYIILDTDKLEKSNEISKTSSDTSVESQIQSNMGVDLIKKDLKDDIQDFVKDFDDDLVDFPLSGLLSRRNTNEDDRRCVEKFCKSSQTDNGRDDGVMEKFTQTIDVPDFLDEQERKDKKRLEEKYRMLKIKYNKLKRKTQQQQQQQQDSANIHNISTETNNVTTDSGNNKLHENESKSSGKQKRVIESDDENNHHRLYNENEYNDRTSKYECLESLKNNLRKIDAMIDLVPSNYPVMHYKYPFRDVVTDDEDISTAGSDISYIRHRIHIEQKSVSLARDALRREEEKIRMKLRRIAGLEQLAQVN